MIEKIRKELKKRIDEKYRKGEKRFFREEIKPYGVRSAEVKKIADKYWREIKNWEKEKVWQICEELWQSGWFEEGGIAINWSFRVKNKYEEKEMELFESWLKRYVKNWAHCDVFCTSSVGEMLLKYPKFLKRLDSWAKSKNRWMRRAAGVSLIYAIKKDYQNIFLSKVFEIADKLLKDKDDLVQKGYGWMLKETSNIYPQEVFDFVMKRKELMPRTALRYAIEKLPKEWKVRAMER